ncbi:MAG: signal peptidase II [Pseudolabrys sp.]|jgi:signal peptidase II
MNFKSYLSGPLTAFGLAIAVAACVVDQGSKLYLLFVHDIEAHPIRLGPFFDFVLTRNFGISYGLLQMPGVAGQWILVGFKMLAVLLLWVWLARAESRLTALSLGLIIGGAAGNTVDRLLHGWVVDFVFFHVSAADWRFTWYVFNLADVAIVAGVAGLLYESFVGDRAVKAP